MESLSSTTAWEPPLAPEVVEEVLTGLMAMTTSSSLVIKHIFTTIVFLTLRCEIGCVDRVD